MSDTCSLFPPLETPGLPAWYPLNSFPSKEQVSFHFMAEITIYSDSGAPKNKVSHCFHCFPIYLHEVVGPDALMLVCWMLSFKPPFSFFSFTLIKSLYSFSSLSVIEVVSSAYLRLLIFLPAILIPTCDSASLAFHMVYSVYKLNNQGYNIQPWCSPFPIFVVSSAILTVAASWLAYRFFRRLVKWSGIPISWRIFHSLLWFT